MRLLAIDPGNIESAYVVIDETYRPLAFGKHPNDGLIDTIRNLSFGCDRAYIEMIGHYGTGMPAGTTVFDTCVWIGRYYERIVCPTELVKRATVKTHICGQAKAKDGNVIQALVDRFALGAKNHGKGTVKQPGFFHGFQNDTYQAMALATYAMDMLKTGQAM